MFLKRAFVIIVLLLTLSLFHLVMYLQNVSLGYEIDSLTDKVNKLLADNRNLNSLVARGEYLGRVERIARSSGMGEPENIRYLFLKKS